MSPCTCLKAAKKKSRNSCAPVWKRFSICTRRSKDLRISVRRSDTGASGFRQRVQPCGNFTGRCAQSCWRPDLWPQGWVARGACYSLNLAVGLFVLELLLNLWAPAVSESLGGWIKFLIFDAALLFAILAFRWLEATNFVAVAQPADRYLRFHRSDSGGSAGSDGPHHHLSFRRPVRQLRRDFRDQFSVTKHAGGKCGSQERTCVADRKGRAADC